MGSASSKYGVISFDGDYITIQPKGIASTLAGKKAVRIPLRSVNYIQFESAGRIAEGFFCVNVGQQDHRGTLTQPAMLEARHDPNALLFGRSAEKEFAALRDEVESAIARPTAAASGKIASGPEQISQLAELRDQGILSVAEFEAKKKEILARM
ncbi:DUF4429 domain-containing protein [Curtobacterium sp. MCLR17_058]|uniref:DUF4429 domain-containing protein n=1 Tax=Curtobacterium sp. MCLR17_058 TaxID=2175635 RepID=UPI000DAA1EB9|nr:DUF4429 domain-containing protein [Curtobacterium sp. MCLR17_058]WIB42678.1 DUF4429 domain-containing protein [Curtobacterium sp. MCLR17_058]